MPNELECVRGVCVCRIQRLWAVDEDCVLIFISHGLHSTQPSTQPRTHTLDALKLARHLRRCIACHVCILTLAMTHGSWLLLRPHLRRVVTFCVCRYWVVARLVTGRVRAHSCVTRRKHHRPGIAPNANTTHVPIAGSSAAPTKPNHTPSRHSRAKGKLLLQTVTPHACNRWCVLYLPTIGGRLQICRGGRST